MTSNAFQIDVFPPAQVSSTSSAEPIPYESLVAHPQNYYAGSDIVWMLVSSALVLLMLPAVCLLYSGHADRSSALILFRLPLITTAAVGIQWYLWGYAITFSSPVSVSSKETLPWSWYGHDTSGNAFKDILARPIGGSGPRIPELVYVLYQGMFAAFTAALVSGGTIRKVKVGRFLVFIVLWTTLVYDTIARWTWHPAGWSRKRGVMDFAGGTAVHITSGTTVAAFAMFYECETKGYITTWRKFFRTLFENTVGIFTARNSNRNGEQHELRHSAQDSSSQHVDQGTASDTAAALPTDNGGQPQGSPAMQVHLRQNTPDHEAETLQDPLNESPHNVNNVVLGTALMWIGWFGFNGGSALGGNLRAVSACISTHVAACAGGMTSLLVGWCLNELYRKFPSDDDDDDGDPKLSVVQFCDGVIIGLVAITPAAGYVKVWSAAVFGLIAALVGHSVKKLCKPFLFEDNLQIFAIHTGGGGIGMFLTAIFADQKIVGLDGYSTIPDWGVGKRLRAQMLDAFMGHFWSFFSTFAILLFLRSARALIVRDWSSPFVRNGKPKPVKDSLEACIQHRRSRVKSS